MAQIVHHEAAYGVSNIHVPLEGKLGDKFRFTSCCKDSRVDNFWIARKAYRYHPIATVRRREVLICLLKGIRIERGDSDLAHIIVAIVWWDVFLVQIPVLRHRVPCPIRIASDFTDVIPVIFGPSVIHHTVWIGLDGK